MPVEEGGISGVKVKPPAGDNRYQPYPTVTTCTAGVYRLAYMSTYICTHPNMR